MGLDNYYQSGYDFSTYSYALSRSSSIQNSTILVNTGSAALQPTRRPSDDSRFQTTKYNNSVYFRNSSFPNSNFNNIKPQTIQEPPIINKTNTTLNVPINYEGLSRIEELILKSNEPLFLDEAEEISINGCSGIWANKSETINWKGPIPISEYSINQDPSPEIIKKKSNQKLEYIQSLAVRYLKPISPQPPGDIVINQLPNVPTPPAPPLIIRQHPKRPITPEPLIIREAPPPLPPAVGRKVITISGKRLPPPPRKVVIERLPQIPAKPRPVIIERWLPYAPVQRKVIYNKPPKPDPIVVKPKNVIIEWETPKVEIKQQFRYLGIVKADPVEYAKRYSDSLKKPNELPKFVKDIRNPDGIVLAADQPANLPTELYGDVSALKLVDLEKEGLGEYRGYLNKMDIKNNSSISAEVVTYATSTTFTTSISEMNQFNEEPSREDIAIFIEQIFSSIDTDANGKISIQEVEKIALSINNRFGKRIGENDLKAFFSALAQNNVNSLNKEELRRAFFIVLG